jgi:CheY-like chemotaxis protein
MAHRFLVVEDDETTASLIVKIIQSAFPGSEVRTARTNEEATRILADFIPNLITTDIAHPGESGFALLVWLRGNPQTSSIPVVSISGQASDQQRLAQYEHGFDAVIPKPWKTHHLIKSITKLLSVPTDPDALLIRLGVETQTLDYKETVDLTSKRGRASLAKDVMAMANFGGGTIVVGVAESRPGEFVPRGVPESLLDSLETSRLNRAVSQFLDPPAPITVRRVRDGDRVFAVLSVPATTSSLVFVRQQNEDAGIYPGRIYTRTSSAESAEVRTSSELRDLLDRLRRRVPS